MNLHQPIGGPNHVHLASRRETVGTEEDLAAESSITAVHHRPIEHVQDAVVVDAPVQFWSAPAAHAPSVNTATVSQRTSAILVYQAE